MADHGPCNCEQAQELTGQLQILVDYVNEHVKDTGHWLLRDHVERAEKVLKKWEPEITVTIKHEIPATVESIHVRVRNGEVVSAHDENGMPVDFLNDHDKALAVQMAEEKRAGG